VPTTATDLSFRGVALLPTSELPALLARWRRDILRGDDHLTLALDRRYDLHSPTDEIQSLLDVHARARILCLTRVAGSGSAVAVNQTLHDLFRKAIAERNQTAQSSFDSFFPGEPVIILRNDYGRGLYNGDLGIVIRANGRRGDERYVAFARPGDARGLVFHPLAELRGALSLAFALTVHKAQGAEYDHVALILPSQDLPLLSREILYTAVTRAKQSVVVVGDPALLARGAARVMSRASGLQGID